MDRFTELAKAEEETTQSLLAFRKARENGKNAVEVASIKAKANIKTLDPYTHPHYPWFPLLMPDVYRAKLFIDDLKNYEQKGELPNLIRVVPAAER